MQIELLGATHLSDHTKFWETEHRFETMEIHAHGFLRLVVFFWRGLSRILRGILRLSISGSQPLAIDLRHWPQIWRRARVFEVAKPAAQHRVEVCHDLRETAAPG